MTTATILQQLVSSWFEVFLLMIVGHPISLERCQQHQVQSGIDWWYFQENFSQKILMAESNLTSSIFSMIDTMYHNGGEYTSQGYVYWETRTNNMHCHRYLQWISKCYLLPMQWNGHEYIRKLHKIYIVGGLLYSSLYYYHSSICTT